MLVFLQTVTLLALGFLAWHLVLWPAILGRIGPVRLRAPDAAVEAADLPRLAVLVPAHNEAATIAAKIANTCALDYPAGRLRLVLVLDGCTDATEAVARATLASLDTVEAEIVSFARNRGKVAALNAGFSAASDTDVVIVTDCSAELAPDAARRLAAAFRDPRLGAIGAGYAVPAGLSEGDDRFWRAQCALKAAEARIAAPMGLHGACYAVRRALVEPLPEDTINDDFAIPMRLAAAGWRVAYDPTIAVTEREASDMRIDFRRRRRIGAGNCQQSLRHLALADPRRPLLALVFLSGKGSRPLVGPAMVVALLGSVMATAAGAPGFGPIAVAQVAGYLGVGAASLWPPLRQVRALGAVHHLVVAQIASTLGALGWLAGRDRSPWTRVTAQPQSAG